jgi:hypothetical protein
MFSGKIIAGFIVPGNFEHLFENSRKFPESFAVNLSCNSLNFPGSLEITSGFRPETSRKLL